MVHASASVVHGCDVWICRRCCLGGCGPDRGMGVEAPSTVLWGDQQQARCAADAADGAWTPLFVLDRMTWAGLGAPKQGRSLQRTLPGQAPVPYCPPARPFQTRFLLAAESSSVHTSTPTAGGPGPAPKEPVTSIAGSPAEAPRLELGGWASWCMACAGNQCIRPPPHPTRPLLVLMSCFNKLLPLLGLGPLEKQHHGPPPSLTTRALGATSSPIPTTLVADRLPHRRLHTQTRERDPGARARGLHCWSGPPPRCCRCWPRPRPPGSQQRCVGAAVMMKVPFRPLPPAACMLGHGRRRLAAGIIGVTHDTPLFGGRIHITWGPWGWPER